MSVQLGLVRKAALLTKPVLVWNRIGLRQGRLTARITQATRALETNFCAEALFMLRWSFPRVRSLSLRCASRQEHNAKHHHGAYSSEAILDTALANVVMICCKRICKQTNKPVSAETRSRYFAPRTQKWFPEPAHVLNAILMGLNLNVLALNSFCRVRVQVERGVYVPCRAGSS